MKKNEEMYCGNCCWFYGECTEGDGFCANQFAEMMNCGDECTTNEFVSRKEMRHHMAVLLQLNRYRRDTHFPCIYKTPKPSEVSRAIEFSVRYMKVFREL